MSTSLKQQASRWTCWHPLLPAFSARIIIGLRTLVGIACCAALTLSPTTSNKIQGQLLLGISFIVAIKSTLGATVQAAIRLILGGAIATSYCLPIVNLCPRNVYFAVGATSLLVFLIVYTDLPVTVRRFCIVPTCIILLQWFNKTHINTSFVLQIWASLSLGSTLAVAVTCIPFPFIPTAHRELTMRMRFVARQTRREVTAIVLLISEYHNVHLGEGDDLEQKSKIKRDSSEDNDVGIEIPSNTYRDDDLHHQSASFENLKDDHLLKSDIQDLHSLVNDELKQMQRALSEIADEPYFRLLNLLNFVRRLLQHVPVLNKFVKNPSTLQSRLAVWVKGFVSLQRTITGMLTLDHHYHAFVGQRKLINAICLLLDSTFQFLDETLPYTTASNSPFKTAQIMACRTKVEDALEHFFETYTRVRENPNHASTSNTDAIRLNTFLLLVLRFVHITIITAEKSETPGSCLQTEGEPTADLPKSTLSCDWKQPLRDLASYIGLRPSFGKLARSIKTSLSVLVSAIVVLLLRERLQAFGWVYWAPMTTALVSDSSEGGTLRLSFQRLMAVLLGSTYAYIVVIVTQNRVAVGICICSFVGFMGYIKTDSRKEYFASVCAQSASIITFLSNQPGQKTESNKTVLARTSLTFLGIFIHVFISNLILPITARALIKKKIALMLKNVSAALQSTNDDFCSFIGPTVSAVATTTKPSFNLMKTLEETERIADNFPALLEEALNEPNFWKRPFMQVKDRYEDMSKSIRQIILDIRFIHRCTTILKAESKLHFAQEAKWQQRRASLITLNNIPNSIANNSWKMTELRKEKQLIKDFDLPLTLFMPHSSTHVQSRPLVWNASSASLRMANTTLYQPVLEHFRSLEKYLQQVISLTGKIIEKHATVDVGSFELQQLCREDSYDEQQMDTQTTKRTLNRGPSFYAVPRFEGIPRFSNHYTFFSCCESKKHDTEALPSLRNAVDVMLASLIQFLYANNRFIRTEFVSNQSIGDVLAFHTLSFALKDMVEATTSLAKNARRIKHIDTRTLTRSEREEKSQSQPQTA